MLNNRSVFPCPPSIRCLASPSALPERNAPRVKVVGVNEKCLLSNPDVTAMRGCYAYQNFCAVMDGRYAATKTPQRMAVLVPGAVCGIGDNDDAFCDVPSATGR